MSQEQRLGPVHPQRDTRTDLLSLGVIQTQIKGNNVNGKHMEHIIA